MRHFIKYDLIPLLSILSVAFFPPFFLYARNCDQVPPSSMIPFLLVFSITGVVLFAFFLIFLKNASQSALLADISLLVVINFCLVAVHIKRILPFMRDRYLLLFFLIVILVIFLLLLRKKPDLGNFCLLILIAFSSMIVINLVLAVPTFLSQGNVPKPSGENPPPKSEEILFGENRPNVYLFLFDEYGGYENLLYYYDYDNTPFLQEMEKRGFNVARESRNSEAVETVTIIPNLLNLDYKVNRWSPYKEKLQLLDNTRLSRIFRDNGYEVQLINHVDFLGKTGLRVLTKNQTRRTISEILMKNSLFYKFSWCRKQLDYFFNMDYGANYRASLDNALEMGLHCWETHGPTLTIGYIQCPHSPTMVGPNGEELPYEYGWNWKDSSLYLGQVEFINKYILSLVDTIQTHDPEAMIIIMSDHGNRYAIHMVQVGQWENYDPEIHNPPMQNILNCVYYQGKSFPIEGQTGINTLRLMFREVLGADLPPITPIEDFTKNYRDEGN